MAETGKISDAAQKLFISAPALSTSISRLEKELGIRLFDRTNNRIILSKADTHMTDSPAEEDIIAATTYTLHGWVPEAVVIDLTGIDYNGPVYITYDTLPGTFMLFSSIEFVSYSSEDADEGLDADWTTYQA